MDGDLEPAPEPTPEELAAFDDQIPTPRPPWWRWIAVIVVVSLVVATPFVYALYRVFD
jgi:hypothetical protein